jgi:hypothetical protein
VLEVLDVVCSSHLTQSAGQMNQTWITAPEVRRQFWQWSISTTGMRVSTDSVAEIGVGFAVGWTGRSSHAGTLTVYRHAPQKQPPVRVRGSFGRNAIEELEQRVMSRLRYMYPPCFSYSPCIEMQAATKVGQPRSGVPGFYLSSFRSKLNPHEHCLNSTCHFSPDGRENLQLPGHQPERPPVPPREAPVQ